MIRTLLESSDHAEKVAKTIGAPRWLCHALKNSIRRKKLILLPSLFYVSGGLTEMLHTILELADYPIRISVAIDVH